jgi:molecular chaperone DnaK
VIRPDCEILRTKPQKAAAAADLFRVATSVLGIDFGTSCTKAAVVVDGRMRLILDDAQSHLSSIVQVPRQGGLAAVALSEVERVDPARTITSIKRLLGRSYTDPRVKEIDAGVGYHLVRGSDGSAHVRVDQVEISPIQVVATVLRNVRELAERVIGKRIDRAVLSMPVRTCPGYIPALTRAAQIAGLSSVRLVYEPVAALWGSMIRGTGQPRRILISDFGAGTYDCALLEVSPDRVEVLACGGDEYLGGDDFDLALADRVAGNVFREERTDLRRDRVFWTAMLRACERS